MINSKILKNAVGVQQGDIKDKTESNTLPSTNTAIVVGKFKRGMVNQPFKVTHENYKAMLGRDVGNPSYMTVEDAFNRGLTEIWVLRIASSLDFERYKNFEQLERCLHATLLWSDFELGNQYIPNYLNPNED